MCPKVLLSSFKINSLWITVVYEEGPVLLANSIPAASMEESRELALEALRGRGITNFEVSKAEAGADLARKIMSQCSDSIKLSYEGMPAFTRAVLDCVRKIPSGRYMTYKDVAVAVGRPRAYRAVGNVMASHPFPYLIPCHRVIRSDLSIGGYGPDPALKEKFLVGEGVQFEKGRATVKHRQAQDK